MENKTWYCPYSSNQTVRCDRRTLCIECRVYFPDTMDKIFTAHNNASDTIDQCRGCTYDGQCVYPRPCVVNGVSCRSTAYVA